MNEIATLLSLPFDTLFVVAVGYLGFRAAYIGRGAGNNAIDTLFLSAVFGLIAKATVVGLTTWPVSNGIAYPASILVTLSLAYAWRGFAQELVFKLLRWLRINDHDGFSNVWQSMLARPLPVVSQVVVRLKSGRHVMCDNTVLYQDYPLGPVLFGEDGSVALYVTHVRTDPVEGWVEQSPVIDGWGNSMTFIRADEISDVSVRRFP
jgi:hypothetical protein